jgi:hypothetical protein
VLRSVCVTPGRNIFAVNRAATLALEEVEERVEVRKQVVLADDLPMERPPDGLGRSAGSGQRQGGGDDHENGNHGELGTRSMRPADLDTQNCDKAGRAGLCLRVTT